MHAEEFIAELSGRHTLTIPSEVVARLPKSGRARVIVLTGEQDDESAWRAAAYEQFLREDAPGDAAYESLR